MLSPKQFAFSCKLQTRMFNNIKTSRNKPLEKKLSDPVMLWLNAWSLTVASI